MMYRHENFTPRIIYWNEGKDSMIMCYGDIIVFTDYDMIQGQRP
jgi:hypothetical protein